MTETEKIKAIIKELESLNERYRMTDRAGTFYKKEVDQNNIILTALREKLLRDEPKTCDGCVQPPHLCRGCMRAAVNDYYATEPEGERA